VCLGVGLLALAVRVALLPVRPIPQPAVHDEFAYLLGAETFCLGRVTNPPHPMWVHFETFHEIFQPTYAPKYPPAQSLMLALGWKLFGHPWYGVWLSCGLMCAALCWMLQGWLPPRYALLGGLVAVAQWGVAGYWVNSYMGGAIAAAAGALVVGAVPRLARRPSAGVAALGALGVVALANSRPYEGAVTAMGAAMVLLIWRWRSKRDFRELLRPRIALPAAAIIGCGILATLYYNYRVTGNALLMPYALYQAQYGASPIFWMLPLRPPPIYRHEVFRRFWESWDLQYYVIARSWPPAVVFPFLAALRYYLNPISAMCFFAALFLRWTGKVRLVLVMAAISSAGILLERFTLAHYLAPMTGLILLLIALGSQFIRVKFGARAFAVFVVLFFGDAAYQASQITESEYSHKVFTENRRNVLQRLEAAGGSHLIIVRYTPSHMVHEEWVYNHADIDGAAIVWARDMGEGPNRELLDYYPSRKAWLLEADAPNPTPASYLPR
jgi:hypothetical protein